MNNSLSKIFEKDKIVNLLSNLKNEQAEIFVWKLIGDQKHLASIAIEAIRIARGDFILVASPGNEPLLNDILAGSGNIDFYVPSSGTLFRSKFKKSEENRFYLEIPSFFAQSERRKSLRAEVYEEDFEIRFQKKTQTYKEITQTFSKKCFDISTGGFSFFISKTESPFFRKGDEFGDISLKFGPWGTTASAHITRVTDVEPTEQNGLRYKAQLVSCSFLDLNDIHRKQLEKLIFERIKDDLHAINS